MSSHPGQAGKFRPNKPQPKSVIPPGVTSNAAVPEINKKPHDSGLNKYPTSRTDGKRTGPTQSSNRFVIPKGQVFFTGGSAAQSNGDKKKASSSSSKGSRGPSSARSIIVPGGSSMPKNLLNQRSNAEGDEIIIGTVDDGEGVGDTKNSSTARSRKKDTVSHPIDEEYGNTTKVDNLMYTFDSSSSQDEEEEEDASDLRGTTKDPYDNSQPLSVHSNSAVRLKQPLKTPFQPSSSLSSSPTLVQSNMNIDVLNPSSQEWIMFKFPTRLPNFESNQQSTKSSSQSDSMIPLPVQSSYEGDSEMIVADDVGQFDPLPTRSSVFDDSFKDSKAGKFGKIVIHKSGKAYFIVGESPSVRMSLTKGLSCGFLQQAISIDYEQGKYIPLGEVSSNSFTVTPEL